MYILMIKDERELREVFARISNGLEEVSRAIEQIMPRAIVKDVTAFGNSAHVVLSKELLDKKIGVIVLEEGGLNAGR